MKKIISLFLVIFIFTITGCISKKNNYLPNKIIIPISFTDQITRYQSYQNKHLVNYYRYYLDNYSIIESLNNVNHPNFLNTNFPKPAININNLLLVNKKYFLDENYIPNNLVKVENIKYIKRVDEEMYLVDEVLKQYINMEIFAKQNNLDFYLFSGFRSYNKQQKLWEANNFISNDFLALPGFSEHQTGLAVDVACLQTGLTRYFEDTLEFEFLLNNAHKFGFILRYPKDKKDITGYEYEPWHYRYVGVDVARICYEENLTLEEYFYKYLEIPISN